MKKKFQNTIYLIQIVFATLNIEEQYLAFALDFLAINWFLVNIRFLLRKNLCIFDYLNIVPIQHLNKLDL